MAQEECGGVIWQVMASNEYPYAGQLRLELGLRNRWYARGRVHVESYGNPPVIVYAPEHPTDEYLPAGSAKRYGRHGNFFDPAYGAIAARPEWMRRFDKIHAQGARSLPKAVLERGRRWRELDSSMSSDALLMNVFCTPGVVESATVRSLLGVDGERSGVWVEGAGAAQQWSIRPHRSGHAARRIAG